MIAAFNVFTRILLTTICRWKKCDVNKYFSMYTAMTFEEMLYAAIEILFQ